MQRPLVVIHQAVVLMFAHVVHCFTFRWIMIVGPSLLVGCFPCLVIKLFLDASLCLTMRFPEGVCHY